MMKSGKSSRHCLLPLQQWQRTQAAAMPSQHKSAEPASRQYVSSWLSTAPSPAPQQPVLTGAAAIDGIKRQMKRNGVKIEEGTQPSGSARFDKSIFINDVLKYRLVGSAEGWVTYNGASGLLIIKHRHRQVDVVKTLPLSEELQLHGLMLLCARASHVDFVQGWERPSDGSFGYCVQQLLHRSDPETKYLMFLKRQHILAAIKGFVTGLHELLHVATAHDVFLEGNAAVLGRRLC